MPVIIITIITITIISSIITIICLLTLLGHFLYYSPSKFSYSGNQCPDKITAATEWNSVRINYDG